MVENGGKRVNVTPYCNESQCTFQIYRKRFYGYINLFEPRMEKYNDEKDLT